MSIRVVGVTLLFFVAFSYCFDPLHVGAAHNEIAPPKAPVARVRGSELN